MSKYFNSIVTCHRGRRLALRAFLRAFSLAVKHLDKDSFEIVITDMDDSESLINKYSDVLNINLCKVKYDGPFCRSKSLNHAVLNSQGQYITTLDVDSIVTKNFMQKIIDFYSDEDMGKVKLCHRVRTLDIDTSLAFLFNNFDESMIKTMFVNYDNFDIHVERYTKHENTRRNGAIPEPWLKGDALGNSQFTMLKSIFMELGGYDERFVGKGSQDLDFNLRAYRFMGGGYLFTDYKTSLYHLRHGKIDESYCAASILYNNHSRYLENKSSGAITIPVSSSWGKF